jgi:hypothetical protein
MTTTTTSPPPPPFTSTSRSDLDRQALVDFANERPSEVRQIFARLADSIEAQWILRSPRTGKLHAVGTAIPSAVPSADEESSLLIFEFPQEAGPRVLADGTLEERGYGILIYRYASPADLSAESGDLRALYDGTVVVDVSTGQPFRT